MPADVVLTGDALAFLSARPAAVTAACAADGRGPREGETPHGGIDIGLIFVRGLGPHAPAAFHRLMSHLAHHPSDSDHWMLYLTFAGLNRCDSQPRRPNSILRQF